MEDFQTLVNATVDYSDYRFRLRPEYEFQHEILRLGPDAEVLSRSGSVTICNGTPTKS